MPLTGSQRVACCRARAQIADRIVHTWGQLCSLQALPCSPQAKQAAIPGLLDTLRAYGASYAALRPRYSRSQSDA